jgi:hypothetical protein
MLEGPIQPQLTLDEAHEKYKTVLAKFFELRRAVDERDSSFFTRFYRKRLDENEIMRFQECYDSLVSIITSESVNKEAERMKSRGDFKLSLCYHSVDLWLDMSDFLSQF